MSTLGFLLIALGALIAFEALKNLTTGSPSGSAASSTPAGSNTTSPATSQPPTSHSSLPQSQLDADISQALQLASAPSEWLPGIRNIVLNESNGDPGAQNPVHVVRNGIDYGQASGLGQTLPGTFAENAIAGHGNIWDPIDNLIATINYVRKRYGSPASVCWNQGGCAEGY